MTLPQIIEVQALGSAKNLYPLLLSSVHVLNVLHCTYT